MKKIINKNELAKLMANKTSRPKIDMLEAISAFQAVVESEISKGNEIHLNNFGSFRLHDISHDKIVFETGDSLKRRLQKVRNRKERIQYEQEI